MYFDATFSNLKISLHRHFKNIPGSKIGHLNVRFLRNYVDLVCLTYWACICLNGYILTFYCLHHYFTVACPSHY